MHRNSEIKIATKNEKGVFEHNPLIQFNSSTSPKLLLCKEDILCLLKLSDWRNTHNKLSNSGERAYMNIFLNNLQEAELIEAKENIIIVIEIEINISKIILDTLLASATDAYAKLAKDFKNIKRNALLNGVTMTLDNPANDFEIKNRYFFEQNPSILQVKKLISVILDLQEQVWLWTRKESDKLNPKSLERNVSRTHTAYGRLASFISWPGDKIHPLSLSEEGFVNTSDTSIRLRHYLNTEVMVEEDAANLRENIASMDSSTNTINVPLYKTINYFPA